MTGESVMKKSKGTEAQIAFILRQAAEETAVGEVAARPRSRRRRSKDSI